MLCVVWWWSTCECKNQFGSDDLFEGQKVGTNAGHGTGEVGPIAGHRICSMRLAMCNGCKLL